MGSKPSLKGSKHGLKDSKGSKTSHHKKGKKSKSSLLNVEEPAAKEPDAPLPPPEPEPEDLKTISIHITGVQNIVPSYETTDLTVKTSYMDNELNTTEKFPWMDDVMVPCSFEFELKVNVLSRRQIDDLLNNPLCCKCFFMPYYKGRFRAKLN